MRNNALKHPIFLDLTVSLSPRMPITQLFKIGKDINAKDERIGTKMGKSGASDIIPIVLITNVAKETKNITLMDLNNGAVFLNCVMRRKASLFDSWIFCLVMSFLCTLRFCFCGTMYDLTNEKIKISHIKRNENGIQQRSNPNNLLKTPDIISEMKAPSKLESMP